MKQTSQLFQIDWMLLIPVIYLLVIGLAVLQSLASAGNSLVDIQSQITALAIGVIGMIIMRSISIEAFLRAAPFVYAGSIVMLVAVLVVGTTAQGAERWIEVAGLQFQPSELAKIGLILMLARLMSLRREIINLPLSFGVITFYAAVPAVLVVLQPDLGTTVTLFLVWISMLAVSRLRSRSFVLLLIALVLSGVAATPFLASYQQDRITSFLSPTEDPLGANYNVLQSEIAVGSGGLFGQGLEAGSQSQYNFLPSAHTDFIFAVTAEKLGIVGALSILIASLLIVLRALSIAWSAKSEFGRYAAVGIAVILCLQFVVNIGMNIGVLPVTGLPLPFMSFGGTHLVIELVMVGMLLAIRRS